MTYDDVLEFLHSIGVLDQLSNIQELVFQSSWESITYAKMADRCSYDAEYIRHVGSEFWKQLSKEIGTKVTKKNCRAVLRQIAKDSSFKISKSNLQVVLQGQVLRDKAYSGLNFTDELNVRNSSNLASPQVRSQNKNQTWVEPTQTKLSPHTDWGEAINVSIFYGRTVELVRLEQWIIGDREHHHCSMVAILGIGGIGKTSLSVKLAKHIHQDFDYVIWRSLRNAKPLQENLAEIIDFLSDRKEINLPKNSEDRIARLINYLQKHRCLIVLDNFDTILQTGNISGQYRQGYEDYGQFLQQVGEISHQSCLVITSREKPREIEALQGEIMPVRTITLQGLNLMEGKRVLNATGLASSKDEASFLVKRCSGNPLMLKILASSIHDLFNGDINSFLQQKVTIFNGVRQLLERQFQRLTDLEIQVMYWLAINREPISPDRLQSDIVPSPSGSNLLEALVSLAGRSLIERTSEGFTQQPVVMEYITDKLIENISSEIIESIVPGIPLSFTPLKNFALVKATAKDYVRESQIRLILVPLIQIAIAQFGSKQALLKHLLEIVNQLRSHPPRLQGYITGNIINLIVHLCSDLTNLDFSHLTIRQAYLKEVTLHGCNFSYADVKECVFAESLASIIAVAFSPDGRLLATGDSTGQIQVRQISESKQLFTCRGHSGWVWFVRFSPNNQILASCGQDHSIRLWDVSTGECIRMLDGHVSMVNSIDFSPDGQILVSGSEDAEIKLWYVATGELLSILLGHINRVWTVTFSPNGQTIASGAEDRTIKLWDVKTGECVKTLQGHLGWVRAIAFSPDGNLLYSGSVDRTVKLWDVHTGDCLGTLLGHDNAVASIDVSPDGKLLASGSYDCTVRLWDVMTGQCVRTLQGHTQYVWSVAFSPDGKMLVSGGDDYAVKLWDVINMQCLKTIQGHSNELYKIAFCPNKLILASGNEDKTVKLWDINTGQYRTLKGHSNRVFSVAFSPDGTILASGSSDRTIRLWDWSKDTSSKTLAGHESWVWSVAFSPDGKMLASGSYDRTIKFWDISTGTCLKTLQDHTASVQSVAFSFDGKLLASGSDDQSMKLWEVATGKCLRNFQESSHRIWSVAFSPDAKNIVTGGDDRIIKLWQTSSGECLRRMEGHENEVLSTAFSKDGKTLISTSADKTIKLWNVGTGECIRTLLGHEAWVSSGIFSPDNLTLVSCSIDGTIKLWDTLTGECLKTLRSPRPYENMDITGINGLTEAQENTLKSLGAIEI